jgi:hypothetical protein
MMDGIRALLSPFGSICCRRLGPYAVACDPSQAINGAAGRGVYFQIWDKNPCENLCGDNANIGAVWGQYIRHVNDPNVCFISLRLYRYALCNII